MAVPERDPDGRREEMAVRIRLRRMGRKKQPHYRVVVADKRSPRDGRFVETLGYYKPRSEPARLVLDLERLDYWIQQGATPSHTVRSLVSKARKGGDDSVALGEPDTEAKRKAEQEVLAAARKAEAEAAEEAAKAEKEAKAKEAEAKAAQTQEAGTGEAQDEAAGAKDPAAEAGAEEGEKVEKAKASAESEAQDSGEEDAEDEADAGETKEG